MLPDNPSIHGFFIEPNVWRYREVKFYKGYNSVLRTRVGVPKEYPNLDLYNYGTCVKGWAHFDFKQTYGGFLNWNTKDTKRWWTIRVSQHWLTPTYKRIIGNTCMWLHDFYEREHKDVHNRLWYNLEYTWLDKEGIVRSAVHAKNIIGPRHVKLQLESIRAKEKL